MELLSENNDETDAVTIDYRSQVDSPWPTILAIIILVLFAIKNATDAAVGGNMMILVVLVDLALAYGLYANKEKYKKYTICRAIAGGIFWPLLTLMQSDFSLAFIVGLTEWGFSGSILLLLVGKAKRWRLIAAVIVFLVFTFSIYVVTMLAT